MSTALKLDLIYAVFMLSMMLLYIVIHFTQKKECDQNDEKSKNIY